MLFIIIATRPCISEWYKSACFTLVTPEWLDLIEMRTVINVNFINLNLLGGVERICAVSLSQQCSLHYQVKADFLFVFFLRYSYDTFFYSDIW